jgi:chaperonin GroES
MANKTSMDQLTPTGDRVVIKPNEADKMTAGGIALPDSAQEKTYRGKVLSVGPGRLLDNGQREPVEVAVGDEVLYDKWGGTEIELNGADVRVMRLADIIGVVNKA